MIDLALLAIIGFFGMLGMWRGAVRQISHVGALIIAWMAARPLAQQFGPTIAKQLGQSSLFTSIVSSFVFFFLAYIATNFIFRHVLSALLPDGENGTLNRLGGFALGIVKSAAFCAIALSGMLLLEKPITSIWPKWRTESDGSKAVQFLKHHSVFGEMPQFGGLGKLMRDWGPGVNSGQNKQSPSAETLLKNSKFRSLIGDAAVLRAIETGSWADIATNAKALEALDDPSLSKSILDYTSKAEQDKSLNKLEH